ncbi:hypothetical protein D3C80_1434290 [compost metagenome]
MAQAIDHQGADAWSVERQVPGIAAGGIVAQRMLADTDAQVPGLVRAWVQAREQHGTP